MDVSLVIPVIIRTLPLIVICLPTTLATSVLLLVASLVNNVPTPVIVADPLTTLTTPVVEPLAVTLSCHIPARV